jgi:hypothetical protein
VLDSERTGTHIGNELNWHCCQILLIIVGKCT